MCSLTLAHRCLPLPFFSIKPSYSSVSSSSSSTSALFAAGQLQWCKARSNGVTPLSVCLNILSSPLRASVR
uniref:Secreted protein n=1 Tax=Anabas testudineus TaxID=64144 RepID=A0A7N6C0G1_ANATE